MGKRGNKLRGVFAVGLIALITSCSSKGGLNEYELKGNVKNYFEQIYDAEHMFGKWEKGRKHYSGHEKAHFDKNGLYLETEIYNDDMALSGKIIPIRDDKGRIVELHTYHSSDGDAETMTKELYNYVSKEKIEHVFYTFGDEKVFQWDIMLKNGKPSKRVETNVYDNDELTMIYEYDKKGNLVYENYLDKEGNIAAYMKYDYLDFDAKGNWTEMMIYENDKPLEVRTRAIEYY